MTCRVSASSAPEPERASWLLADTPLGPRSRRILSLRREVCGLAKTTGENWTPDGLQATEAQQASTDPTLNCDGLARAETRQAFHEAHLQARRTALIGTARHLRNQMRCSEASTCEAELRAVTHELLAMGGV